ncbi:S41 family peptidase [Fulvivirga lutimaris]|uniref:S41 family peptidase n=1 Tax=Fulvivirga lutimaris TaxID=1819566 RepID=UPI0012BD7793|nr:S41 family peptidase [Fulvivirga lutimaris]MTI41913.1 peptidase S41 [Fulvivirga lutimaris]
MKQLYTVLILACSILGCQAQKPQHEALVTELARDLKQNYVFEKEANAMHDMLLAKLEEGKYNNLEKEDLAEALHEDLRAVANDKHLRIRYGNRRTAPSKFAGREIKSLPNGVGEVEILEGNIGYLELTGFSNPNGSYRDMLAEKMEKLASTKAVIFDLRNNGGGSPEAVRLLSSYLFPEDEAVHLNSLYYRNRDVKTDYYTLKEVEGSRIDQLPVYILTSDFTFSAGEEFCYNLLNLKRATLVGETTGGGAHPVNFYNLPEGVVAIIPEGRAINPITQTNWEGVGVVPHYKVDEAEALDKTLSLIGEDI